MISAWGRLPPFRTVHTDACKLIPEGKEMRLLNLIEQEYILDCPHKSHEAVRLMYRSRTSAR